MESISDNSNESITEDHKQAEVVESSTQTDTPATTSADTRPKMTWWMFSLIFLVILALFIGVFWKPLLLAIAPKPALGIALSNTANALSERYTSCPLRLLPTAKKYFYNGQIETELTYQHEKTDVKINAQVRTDWANKRVFTDGIFNFNEKELNANAYLDYNTAAIALDGFRKGAYIGFNYDTLKEDLNNTPLKLLLSDEKMQELCASVEDFREYFRTETNVPDAPDTNNTSFVEVLIECAIKLDAESRSCDATLGETVYPCEAVSFDIDHETLVYLLEHLLTEISISESAKFLYLTACTESGDSDAIWSAKLAQLDEKLERLRQSDSANCDVDFYIYEGYVVCADIDLSATSNGNTQRMQLQIDLGPEPGKSDIRIDYITQNTASDLHVSLTSVSKSTSECYDESFSLSIDTNDAETNYFLSVDWVQESGVLSGRIRVDNREVQEQSDFSMTLFEKEYALTISADQNALRYILPYIGIKNVPQDAQYTVSLIMKAGEDFVTPEYTNISQWKTMWLLELVYYLGKL